jgi:hypothetical protein
MAGRISVGLQDLNLYTDSYPNQTLDLSRRELTQVPRELSDSKDLEVSQLCTTCMFRSDLGMSLQSDDSLPAHVCVARGKVCSLG